MNIELLLLFLPACFALNRAPGPNNLLSVVNGSRHGFLPLALLARDGWLLSWA